MTKDTLQEKLSNFLPWFSFNIVYFGGRKKSKMGYAESVVIAWCISCLVVSLLLCLTIHEYISTKPLVTLTLVDLIYRDTLVYMYLLAMGSYIGIISCITSTNGLQTIGFTWSAVLALQNNICINSFSVSMIFRGSIRLISMIKNSEESGNISFAQNQLQFFGG